MPQSMLNLVKLKLKSTDQQVWDAYIQHLFNDKLVIRYKAHNSLKNPKISYILDLHGQHLQQAYESLKKFLLLHNDIGSKKVTVITGKGGRIRTELPYWCEKYKFVTKLQPILDSKDQYGSYEIYLKIKKL